MVAAVAVAAAVVSLSGTAHARCTEPASYVCSAVSLTCHTVENTTGYDPRCPQF
jgi:citrate synthase